MKESVDMRATRFPTTVEIFKGCDPAVANGLSAIARMISPSHSLTSRRYSIWTCVKEHLDDPFERFLRSYARELDQHLLLGFRPSNAWRAPDRRVLVRFLMHPEGTPSLALRCFSCSSQNIDSTVAALECWAECIRLVIRGALKGTFDSECERFANTLDSILSFLRELTRLRPRRSADKEFGRVADRVTRLDGETFCELCWRLSMRSQALQNSTSSFGSRRLSARFCEYHNPGDPKSKYRVDHRYKDAFAREVQALYRFETSGYSLSIRPHSFNDEDVRRTAYELVHSRLRPLGSDRPGLREKVLILKKQGARQVEIARMLGISRQAVSKALRQVKELSRC